MTYDTNEKIDKKSERIRACYINARELIDDAKHLLSANSRPARGYHFALLALEETAKAMLLKIDNVLAYFERDFNRINREFDDHEKKLQWAIWSPWFCGKQITPEAFEKTQKLVQGMHKKRLDSLYVSLTSDEIILDILAEEAENLVKFAEARLDMEEMSSANQLDTNKIEEYKWFIDAHEDEEKKKFIFSKTALNARLSYDGLPIGERMYGWIKWLKSECDNQERGMQDLIQKEIDKPRHVGGEALKDKWKITVKFVAISHSIRQKELNSWNNQCKWIQLRDGKNGNLLVKVTLPNSIHIDDIKKRGYDIARRILTALNIGSRGLFWWYRLNKGHAYEEKIEDLEHNTILKTEIQDPYLSIDWGQPVLEQDTLRLVLLCFVSLPDREASLEEWKAFDQYLTAVAFLCKTDLHLNLIVNACSLFFSALKSGMSAYQDLKPNQKFADAFTRIFSHIIRDQSELTAFIALASQLDNVSDSQDFSWLTFDKVVQVKLLCDAYFMAKFNSPANKAFQCHITEVGHSKEASL